MCMLVAHCVSASTLLTEKGGSVICSSKVGGKWGWVDGDWGWGWGCIYIYMLVKMLSILDDTYMKSRWRFLQVQYNS